MPTVLAAACLAFYSQQAFARVIDGTVAAHIVTCGNLIDLIAEVII